MENLLNTKRMNVMMKTGLALLLGGNIACGEAPTSYSEFVEEGPSVLAFETERQFEVAPEIDLELTGDESRLEASTRMTRENMKLHGGIVSPDIAQLHYKESTTEKERGIPDDYPDLLGEESATFQLLLGTKAMRLTAQDQSFAEPAEGEGFVLEVTSSFSDAAMKLKTKRLDPSQQLGAGKSPDPGFELSLGEGVWSNRSNGECYPSVVLDIDGKSELALWGRIKGTLCDGKEVREFAGTFAALKPGTRALQ